MSLRTLASIGGAFALIGAASAETADLVGHKGFEACWSRSLTSAQFADVVNAANEGYAGCIASTQGSANPYCTQSMCAGNVPGCPITLHASSAVPGSGGADYVRYDATVGIDAFAMDVSVSGSNCIVTINDASNVSTSAQLQFGVTDDGNFGWYVAGLLAVSNVTTQGLQSTDYAVSGDFQCTFAAGFVPASYILAIINSGVEASLWGAQQAATAESICE